MNRTYGQLGFSWSHVSRIRAYGLEKGRTEGSSLDDVNPEQSNGPRDRDRVDRPRRVCLL